MGEPLQRARAGDPFAPKAATWNAFVDAAEAHRNAQASAVSSGGQKGQARDVDVLPVKNDSGADLPRFAVLGIDSPIFTPTDNLVSFQNQPALTCSTPSTASHAGRFVILAEPIKDGMIGRAIVGGVTPVLIDVTDEAHTWADVLDASAVKLQSAETGAARILWKESGTGEKWAIVNAGLGVGAAAAGGEAMRLRAIKTATGSYVIPSGVTSAKLWVYGAGGGGGGKGAEEEILLSDDPEIYWYASHGGGGGASGGVIEVDIADAADPIAGRTLNITLGAAGTGGATENDGTAGGAVTVIDSVNASYLNISAGGGGGGYHGSNSTWHGAGGIGATNAASGSLLSSYMGHVGSPPHNGHAGGLLTSPRAPGGRSGLYKAAIGASVLTYEPGGGGQGGGDIAGQSAGTGGSAGGVLIFY